MNTLEQLVLEARQRRDASIAKAHKRYKKRLEVINRKSRPVKLVSPKMRQRFPQRRLGPDGDYSKMYTIEAGEHVLRELGPMTLIELTIEVQRRGCRSGDCHLKVENTLRVSLIYHSERFSRDEAGRWGLNEST